MYVTITNHKTRARSFTLSIPMKYWEEIGAPKEIVMGHDEYGPILREPLLKDMKYFTASIQDSRVQFFITYYKQHIKPGKYSLDVSGIDTEVFYLEKL